MVHGGPHSMVTGLNTVVVKKKERGQKQETQRRKNKG